MLEPKPLPTQLPTGERRRASALSLSTANKKEEVQNGDVPSIEVDLPKNPFSQADFYVYWKKYIEILTKQGEKMLSAILNSTEPIVAENSVTLTYPNAMMMEEVRKNQGPILNYLRDKLQNFSITFDLHYNESDEKSFVYTPQEKYEKLLEINPLLANFRKLLDLDL